MIKQSIGRMMTSGKSQDKVTTIGREMFTRYMDAYRNVLYEIEKTTGSKPEPYKDLEENLLIVYFENIESKKDMNGLDFMADILSTLVVGQALPNANHRTTMYFIGALLTQNDLKIDTTLHANTIQEYFWDSKHILKKAKKDYIEKHLEQTKIFLAKILGSDQSGRLGSIFAYSIMNSFAASSKDITFLTGSTMNK